MGSSIQDYLKKINSRLTLVDCLSVFATTFIIMSLLTDLYIQKKSTYTPVSYNEYISDKSINSDEISTVDTQPFASKNGKTYTFSWCQGASIISSKNKIYFNTETEAQNSGRTLSKLCQK